MSSKTRARRGRKLLIASVGIATASFVGVGCGGTAVANLGPPPSCDVAPSAPYCSHDAGNDAGQDAAVDVGADVAAEAAADTAVEAGTPDAADSGAQGQ